MVPQWYQSGTKTKTIYISLIIIFFMVWIKTNIDDRLYKLIKKQAKEENRSISNFLQSALRDRIDDGVLD